MKIVSLLPSATEIVFALGLGDSLEGVTYECDYPSEATSKPVVLETSLPQDRPMSAREIDDAVREKMEARSPLYELDRDLIQKIQPDLILAQDLCRVCAVPSGQVERALEEIGCTSTVISLDPRDLGEVLDGIGEVARATGTEARAKDLFGELRGRIESVKATSARLPTIRTFALEWLSPPFAGGHWVPEMVRLAGGENLLTEPREPSRAVTWREVADAQPEVVAFMPCGYYLEDAEAEAPSIYRVHEMATTTACTYGNVFATDASAYFSRPGPRLVEGLEILAWTIHPESYPEPPAGTVTRIPAP